jgi:hypothetical protein
MVGHQMIYSPERKKTMVYNEHYDSFLLRSSVIDNNNLLTLLAADPSSSGPEWVLLHFLSCFPHLCCVPTASFPQSKAGQAPYPLCP